MVTLTITVPESMGALIEAQVASGQFGDASGYLQFLIQREQEQAGGSAGGKATPPGVPDGKGGQESGDHTAPLIHGLPGASASWEQTQAELLRRFRHSGGR